MPQLHTKEQMIGRANNSQNISLQNEESHIHHVPFGDLLQNQIIGVISNHIGKSKGINKVKSVEQKNKRGYILASLDYSFEQLSPLDYKIL